MRPGPYGVRVLCFHSFPGNINAFFAQQLYHFLIADVPGILETRKLPAEFRQFVIEVQADNMDVLSMKFRRKLNTGDDLKASPVGGRK